MQEIRKIEIPALLTKKGKMEFQKRMRFIKGGIILGVVGVLSVLVIIIL